MCWVWAGYGVGGMGKSGGGWDMRLERLSGSIHRYSSEYIKESAEKHPTDLDSGQFEFFIPGFPPDQLSLGWSLCSPTPGGLSVLTRKGSTCIQMVISSRGFSLPKKVNLHLKSFLIMKWETLSPEKSISGLSEQIFAWGGDEGRVDRQPLEHLKSH